MMKRKRGWRRKEEKRRKWKLLPNVKQKKDQKKINVPERNLNVVMNLLNLKRKHQRRRAEEVIPNQAKLRKRRPTHLIQKVRRRLRRNPRSTRGKKRARMKMMKVRMKRLPKRSTPNARVTDPIARMKVLERGPERNPRVLQQMIPNLRVKKRKLPRRKRKRRRNHPVKNPTVRRKDPERSIRRRRNTRSIRRVRNTRSTRRGRMTPAATMPVMMKRKKI